MKTRVFEVSIYYDGSENRVHVLADNDEQARKLALAADEKTFSRAGAKQPKVNYCEIRLLVDDIYVE